MNIIEASQNFIIKLHSTIDSMCAAYLSETGHSGFVVHEKYDSGHKYRVANHKEFPSLEVLVPETLPGIRPDYLQRKSEEWRSLTELPASLAEIVVEHTSEFMSLRIQQRGDATPEERP